eukprot:3206969-Alexandrium_andersonii.AAC.1
MDRFGCACHSSLARRAAAVAQASTRKRRRALHTQTFMVAGRWFPPTFYCCEPAARAFLLSRHVRRRT